MGSQTTSPSTQASPQALLHRKLKERGYSPKHFESRNSGYFNQPTEHQLASFGAKLVDIMKHNLAEHDDWIVLNTTMNVLCDWAKADEELKIWLQPHLERLAKDPRKSVSKKAQKFLAI